MKEKNEMSSFPRMKAFIRKEIKRLDKLMKEAEGTPFSASHPRHIGSLLHDFYTGIERVFEKIAINLDGGIPGGESWHRDLLDSMSLELEGIRPPLIGENMHRRLGEYLRFRHLFRSLYGFELDKKRMRTLYEDMEHVYRDFKKQESDFEDFLNKLNEQIG